jgi:hypothetical protein
MTRNPHINAVSTRREYYKFAAVIIFICLVATLMSTLVTFRWTDWMRWFMGSFFLVFGSFKLIGYEMFVSMFPRYDLIAGRFKSYAYAYPLLELWLGVCFVLDIAPMLRDSIVLFIMVSGSIGVLRGLMQRGPTFHCVCLGNIIKLPLSTVTLFEDLTMGTMAALMLASAIAGI